MVFKYGGIYLDTDTISVAPLNHHLRQSFVAFSISWHMIQNSIWGFPQVQGLELPDHVNDVVQGSNFLKFVLEAARAHFASAQFEKLKLPWKFGPPFFTTMFVSRSKRGKVPFVSGSVQRHKGEGDQSRLSDKE